MEITEFGLITIGLLIVLVAVGSAYSSATVVQGTTNESITVDYNNSRLVDAAGVAVSFFDNETVRNASGAVLTEGTDYDFNTTDGSVTWYNTTATTNASTANVSYWFEAPSQRSQGIATVMRIVLFGAIVLLLFWAGASVFDFVGGGW